MTSMNPITLMALGLLLMLAAFLLLFVMVMRLIEASFLLSFLAYGASFLGLLCGLAGITLYSGRSRR